MSARYISPFSGASLPTLAPLAALLAGCVGILGSSDGSNGGGQDGREPWRDDPTSPSAVGVVPQPVSLRRLAKDEYLNTVKDLVGALLPAERDAVLAAVRAPLETFPDDARVGLPGKKHGGFARLDQVVQQSHADAAYAVGVALGKELTSGNARVGAVFGACATNADRSDDDACVGTFLKRFGERALRRPVTDDDVAFYARPLAAGGATPENLADVLTLVLSAPDLLYKVEVGTKPGEPQSPLTPYEVASRLSYHFLESLPDEELLTLARSGDLARDDVYAKQVDRLASDPRSRRAQDRFFEEWLRLYELERLDSRVGTPGFDALVGDLVPTGELHTRMIQDVLDAAAFVTSSNGSVRDLVTNRQSFARTPDLARIYGAPLWDGKGPPPSFDDPARAGLIARAAFVANPSVGTRPIMKGLRIREALLCDTIPPPPADAANATVPFDPNGTTRRRVENLTERDGTSCRGCHLTILNPLGFATEGFDPLGRVRSKERVFDDGGRQVAELDVDTRSVPHVVQGDETASAGAADVTRMIAASGRIETCFVRHYFRFALGRIETPEDEPAVAALTKDARDGAPMAKLMRTLALRPEFRVKVNL